MERVFLRRRIGVLFCIVGILTILSAISVFFLEPAAQTSAQEKPEPWLVIDPGHGGEDGGAVAADGTPEAELNLQISLRLHALARLCGVQTAMTRQSEHIEYPTDAGTVSARKTADQKQRVEMINGIPNAVLISVHQNWFPTSSPHGAQVLYADTPRSQALGTLTHENLLRLLDPENRRVAAPASNDIFLMRSVECPAILVECGFLSNPQELQNLKNPEYELKLSMVLIGSFLQYNQTGWNQ